MFKIRIDISSKRDFLLRVCKQNQALNNRNIKFYYENNLIEDICEFLSSNKLVEDDIFRHYMDNYDEIEDDLDWITRINYSRLINYKIPSDFFEKFYNIQEIRTTASIVDQKAFSEFTSNCVNLNILELINSNLNQNFYNQLPNICSISHLKINEDKIFKMDFKFILKMSNLINFETNQELVLDDHFDLDNSNLFILKFKINKSWFKMHKNDDESGSYYCNYNDPDERINENHEMTLDQVRMLCKNLLAKNKDYYFHLKDKNLKCLICD